MITIEYIKQNSDDFKSKVKLKNLKGYYDLLFEYNFKDDLDFTPFVNLLNESEDKNECKKLLNEFRTLGVKKDLEPIYYNDFLPESYYEKLEQNLDLITQLNKLRHSALGIGTNKLKRRLNTLAKTNPLAKAYRLALEAEDKSTQAKDSFGKYKDKIYAEKSQALHQLVDVCLTNDYLIGKTSSDVRETRNILYVELPNCEQISYHCSLNANVPTYEKEWDGKINSTFEKLLNGIIKTFPKINTDTWNK
jgi:hypothetical protein